MIKKCQYGAVWSTIDPKTNKNVPAICNKKAVGIFDTRQENGIDYYDGPIALCELHREGTRIGDP